jgi:hypothetical protein
MNRKSSHPLISLSAADLHLLVHRALCEGDTDDADRAAMELYTQLLRDVKPVVGDADAPCIVATLMLALARRRLKTPRDPSSAWQSCTAPPGPARSTFHATATQENRAS